MTSCDITVTSLWHHCDICDITVTSLWHKWQEFWPSECGTWN